ncbi:iron-sulfur cluster assembly 1-like protein, mitochondrial [Platysternon megacephalum]|uniref:Iron-sulfur cluster assembly 1-like protein, mitochondrial n=1 Tax=Platysternon megacephalum TaxID=55544 RepID=A0A4D9EXX8_9SAUR|nr:iron-sulfur cluster assembly 1-like protein, mitochondrial [Platysternon megacephalum]
MLNFRYVQNPHTNNSYLKVNRQVGWMGKKYITYCSILLMVLATHMKGEYSQSLHAEDLFRKCRVKEEEQEFKTSKKDMSVYSTGVHSGSNPSLQHRAMGNQALCRQDAEGVETYFPKLT